LGYALTGHGSGRNCLHWRLALARAKLLFAAEITLSEETITVTVHGEVDLYTAPMLWAWLAQGLRSAPARLVVDLADVTFIDCAGVGALSRAVDLMSGIVEVVLRSPNALAYKVLTLTGLDRRCLIEFESQQPAVGGRRWGRPTEHLRQRAVVDLGPGTSASEERVVDLRAPTRDEEAWPMRSAHYGCDGNANGSRQRRD
jgi:anti-anti-sigma factor